MWPVKAWYGLSGTRLIKLRGHGLFDTWPDLVRGLSRYDLLMPSRSNYGYSAHRIAGYEMDGGCVGVNVNVVGAEPASGVGLRDARKPVEIGLRGSVGGCWLDWFVWLVWRGRRGTDRAGLGRIKVSVVWVWLVRMACGRRDQQEAGCAHRQAEQDR